MNMNVPRILIADDDHDLAEVLAIHARALGLDVRTAHDAQTALDRAREFQPDVACLDVNMPGGNGLSVGEMLANDEKLSAIPIIIMTGRSDAETVRRCQTLRAYYVPKSSDMWQRIEPLLYELFDLEPGQRKRPLAADATNQTSNAAPRKLKRGHMAPAKHAVGRGLAGVLDLVFEMLGFGANPPKELPSHDETNAPADPPWVLCIDDDAEYSHALKLRLEGRGVAVIRAFDGMEGYRWAFRRPADAILLDYQMPNAQGDYALQRLKDNPVTKEIPVIVITGHRDKSLERKMLNLGATAVLNKPVEFNKLVAELRRHISVLSEPCPATASL